MESTKIFEMALGLQAPWSIKEVKMSIVANTSQGQIDIYLSFARGYKYKDSNGIELQVHDKVARQWQHLNFFQHKCILHADIPRVRTAEGKVINVEVPWARPESSFTLLFEAFSMLLIESEMPINSAANLLGVNAQRIWTLFNYWVEKAKTKDDVSKVEILGIDETSTKKGHHYVTVAVNMEERRVIFVSEGKGADCVSKLQKHLEAKGVAKTQIKQACIDMSPAYISGLTNTFPEAQITFDRFHVVKVINEAMDSVRKGERQEFAMLKGHKYTFLKKEANLSHKQREEKYGLLTLYPVIANVELLPLLRH
jgi:transposase